MARNDRPLAPSTTNQYFIHPIGSTNLAHIIIPAPFFKRFDEEEQGQESVSLMSSQISGEWNVKREGDKLTDGWEEFTEMYNLSIGDHVIFKHRGNSVFEVTALDPIGCQLNYKNSDPIGNPRSQKQQHTGDAGTSSRRKKRDAMADIDAGGCPKLEYLVVDLFLGSGINALIINVPSLQLLTFSSGFCIEEKIILQTPCLKYLNTKKLDGVDSFKIENFSKFIEATITHHDERMDENLLSKMKLAQRLSLAAPLKLPKNVIFDDLTSLEIETTLVAWCILLSHMLTYSPKLQVLKLVGGEYSRFVKTWVEPQHTARCLRTHLHTVVWEGYNWDGADDIDVATYILKNAAALTDATFTTLEPSEDTDMFLRQSMLAHLANVERASPSSNIFFRDTSILKRIASSPQDPDMATLVI